MKLFRLLIISMFIFCLSSLSFAAKTERIPQFSNDQVRVWKTIIYPHEQLKMHRHDFDRVVVVFEPGVIRIVSDKNQVSYHKLEKNKAYYFPKDPVGLFHTDENISEKPIQVMVVQLNS